MRKIETVIENCNECKFYKKYEQLSQSKEFAYVCVLKPQLLSMTSSSDEYIQNFSPNCPLENYIN